MSPPSLHDILSTLIERDALLVHCAGTAKGIGSAETNALDFLDRLANAITQDLELSCSTILPGDVSNWDRINYTGRVGLLLRPNSADSITFASPGDAGSQVDPDRPGRRWTNLPSATMETIRDAIINRPPDRYNELGVFNYTVLGIFVDPPIQYSTSEGFESVEISDIESQFPHQRLYCLRAGVLYDIERYAGQLRAGSKVNISSLYRLD